MGADSVPCLRAWKGNIHFAELAVRVEFRTKILDFRGFDSSRILWNSHVHREFPGNRESTDLSRGNISREIGRMGPDASHGGRGGCPGRDTRPDQYARSPY